MSTWYRLVYLGACPLPGTFLPARNRSSRCRLRCAGLPRRRPHVTQRLKEAAEAHGLAAWCQIQRIWNESAELSADLASALAHAKAVMAIRTDDASTLAFAANAYARATRDYDTAIQMTEPALAQNPAMPMRWRWGRWVNTWAGRHDQSIRLSERALRCSPFDPARHLAFAALARARLFKGDADAALIAARRAAQASPGHLPWHGYVIISLVRLGRTQELGTTIEQLLTSFPNIRLTNFLSRVTFEPFTAELTAAGLPT